MLTKPKLNQVQLIHVHLSHVAHPRCAQCCHQVFPLVPLQSLLTVLIIHHQDHAQYACRPKCRSYRFVHKINCGWPCFPTRISMLWHFKFAYSISVMLKVLDTFHVCVRKMVLRDTVGQKIWSPQSLRQFLQIKILPRKAVGTAQCSHHSKNLTLVPWFQVAIILMLCADDVQLCRQWLKGLLQEGWGVVMGIVIIIVPFVELTIFVEVQGCHDRMWAFFL